ncbi:hypothetical protein [Paracoccus sp. S1E-3]|uniref:hypothetical protein n=1 Tax=Paracoccus sp. S1E-3 TaxID=2756130 RepID=UPI0015EF3CF4|nr:hypothetical protein [Paracoccus sp. S1E-3]MBA4492545.1 hypothetical protein [Paracoccus sp. S1E-3]
MFQPPLPAGLAALCLTVTPASAQPLEVASQREGVEIRAVASLPANPTPPADAAICGTLPAGPETTGGKAAAAADWIVTGEITQGDLTFVSFAAKATAGTSGSCLLEGGNVGIFRGPALQGLVYAAAGRARAPGTLQPLVPEGIRIWDGDYGPSPLADLRIISDQLILLRPPADRDLFCGGAISVPSLYGLPIHQARILLLAEGWQPTPPPEQSPSDYVQEMAKALPEVQDCSGTGFGYCNYAYARESGATLSVTSAG